MQWWILLYEYAVKSYRMCHITKFDTLVSFDRGFIGVIGKLGEFWDFSSPGKFGPSDVFRQRRHIIRPMKANIKVSLDQDLFNHVSYIALLPKVVLLDIPKYLVDILISLHHNYFRVILGMVYLNYPWWRLFDRHLVIR